MSMVAPTARGGVCQFCQRNFVPVMANLRLAFVNATYAASLGTACAASLIAVTKLAATITEAVLVEKIKANIIRVAADDIARDVAIDAVTNDAARAVIKNVLIVGAMQLLGTIIAAAAVAKVGAAIAATEGLAGRGVAWILNRRGIDRVARRNIGFGMQVGAGAGIAGIVVGLTSFRPQTVLSVIGLVGGAAAGVLSLINREA